MQHQCCCSKGGLPGPHYFKSAIPEEGCGRSSSCDCSCRGLLGPLLFMFPVPEDGCRSFLLALSPVPEEGHRGCSPSRFLSLGTVVRTAPLLACFMRRILHVSPYCCWAAVTWTVFVLLLLQVPSSQVLMRHLESAL